MTRTYTPETPADKLKAAHELLADVAQVLAGREQAAAARVLQNDMDDIRNVLRAMAASR